MANRVVVTGMGVVAPNGIGLTAFGNAIKNGVSGIRHISKLEELQFSCQIAGCPEISEALSLNYFSPLELRNFNSNGILYGVIAALDAWKDAGLPLNLEEPDWDSGTVFGAGTSGVDKLRESIYKLDGLQIRVNSGGQRGTGSMTAPNREAVQRCIQGAISNAGINADEIDVVNGHLTATSKDALEIENWTLALGRDGVDFPYINSLKSLTGHCLSASGSIECVASVLQVYEDFIFPNRNCEDLNEEITKLISQTQIPQSLIRKKITTLIKASFGFGDVNACIILRKFQN